MGHTIGDALIVAALAALWGAYLYFKHVERLRRFDIIHQERVVAMEKGIPLPELPIDPPRVPRPQDPRAPLLHGIVWVALGAGAMVALYVSRMLLIPVGDLWAFPLPLLFLGIGLILYYAVASKRTR